MKTGRSLKALSFVLANFMITCTLCVSISAGVLDDLYGESGFEPEYPEFSYSAKDANTLKRVIAGDVEIDKSSEEFVFFDINEDGALNAKDANVMKRVIAGEIVL